MLPLFSKIFNKICSQFHKTAKLVLALQIHVALGPRQFTVTTGLIPDGQKYKKNKKCINF